jgi:hypothetical protein
LVWCRKKNPEAPDVGVLEAELEELKVLVYFSTSDHIFFAWLN